MATKKISYPYSIMAHDVNDALDRLNRFVKRQLNTEVDSVKVFWNGGAYVGFRFFIGKKEYYWIPSNYDGCYRIEGNSDVLGFVQKLHDTQHREFEPRWWILSVGNSGKKSIEKVCTTILELYKGEA